MGDKDLPLLSNIKDIRARHYLLYLKTDIVSQIIESTVFIFLEPTTACEKKGKCCVRECFCSTEPVLKVDSDKEILDDTLKTKVTKTESIPKTIDTAKSDYIKDIYEDTTWEEGFHSGLEVLDNSVSISNYSRYSSANECQSSTQITHVINDLQGNQNVIRKERKAKSKNESEDEILESHKDFKVVLDCCDIKVKSVCEVVCNENEVTKYLHPNFTRNCSFALNIWLDKDQIPLEYNIEPWCLNVWKTNVKKVEDFPRVICIRYETMPEGKSLLWRKDEDGNPCVFTPAATINNRSLLPCQDPPSAMATWQAWFTIPNGFYLSMTGDEQPVKFVGCIKDYKKSWLLHHSDLKCCMTEEPAQGSTICRQDMEEQNSHSVCFYYHTTMVLPIATIAIAIGKWMKNILPAVNPHTTNTVSYGSQLQDRKEKSNHPCKHYEYPCHIESKVWSKEISLSLVYAPSFFEKVKYLAHFLPFALQASSNLLDTYPCHRVEVVIVPRCFASLGLASPNLIFLSPSMILDDPAAYIRLAHEISHAWFGINIGAQDWTEEWISEGFATYMEDSIYLQALILYQDAQAICDAGNGISSHNRSLALAGCKITTGSYLEELSDLRALIRYRTLKSELENSSEDLQKLRPMQGESLVDDSGIGYVKDGRNPEKTFLQVHYLKGYFLLKYMSKIIGRKAFDSIIKDFVKYYHGQLVLSEHILDFFISAYSDASDKGMTLNGLLEDWLNYPGLNPYITETYGNISNQLVSVVRQHFNYWLHFEKVNKLHSGAKKIKMDLDEISFPDQIVLLLEYILELTTFSCKGLRQIYRHYNIGSLNADVRHRWCELVILHNFPDLSEVRRFLIEDQAMGVYLYGELVISGKKKHRKLAEEVYGKIKEDMDENAKLTVSSMLYGE